MRGFLRERPRSRRAGLPETILIRLFLAGLLIAPAAIAIGIIVSGNYWSD